MVLCRAAIFYREMERELANISSGLLLSDRSRLAKFLPPDFGIGRTLEQSRQFLLNLPQTIGAGFKCGLVERSVLALVGVLGVHVPEIGNFLAEVREAFSDISHPLYHTLYSRISLFLPNP